MTLLRQLLSAVILVAQLASAIEIDRQEVPLLKLSCPLDSNPETDGPHEEIVFLLYKSGIGYSALEIWDEHSGFSTGSTRNTLRFWLEPSLIEAVVSAARVYPATKEIPPRNQQLIIEGSALSSKVISSWHHSGESPLKLFHLLDPRMRDDLLLHFRQVQEIEKK